MVRGRGGGGGGRKKEAKWALIPIHYHSTHTPGGPIQFCPPGFNLPFSFIFCTPSPTKNCLSRGELKHLSANQHSLHKLKERGGGGNKMRGWGKGNKEKGREGGGYAEFP